MEDHLISEINDLLPHADVELLDFICQLLKKSIPYPRATISEETAQYA